MARGQGNKEALVCVPDRSCFSSFLWASWRGGLTKMGDPELPGIKGKGALTAGAVSQKLSDQAAFKGAPGTENITVKL